MTIKKGQLLECKPNAKRYSDQKRPLSFSLARVHVRANAEVSDRGQPPQMFDLFLSEPAGSGSLHRLVRAFSFRCFQAQCSCRRAGPGLEEPEPQNSRCAR